MATRACFLIALISLMVGSCSRQSATPSKKAPATSTATSSSSSVGSSTFQSFSSDTISTSTLTNTEITTTTGGFNIASMMPLMMTMVNGVTSGQGVSPQALTASLAYPLMSLATPSQTVVGTQQYPSSQYSSGQYPSGAMSNQYSGSQYGGLSGYPGGSYPSSANMNGGY